MKANPALLNNWAWIDQVVNEAYDTLDDEAKARMVQRQRELTNELWPGIRIFWGTAPDECDYFDLVTREPSWRERLWAWLKRWARFLDPADP